MTPIIFCAYSSVCDPSFQKPLLDRLKEFQAEGTRIFLTAKGYSCYDSEARMQELGYGDLFSGSLDDDQFGPRSRRNYWGPMSDRFGVPKNALIVIDEDERIIRNAKEEGIHIVDARIHSFIGENAEAQVKVICDSLSAAYKQVCSL